MWKIALLTWAHTLALAADGKTVACPGTNDNRLCLIDLASGAMQVLVPKSQGGTDAEDNLQLLHRHCHLRKHGKLPCSGVNDNHQTTEEPDAGKPARPVLKPSGGSDPFA